MAPRDRSSLAAVDDLLDEIDELLSKVSPQKTRAPAASHDPADGIDGLLGDLGGAGESRPPRHAASFATTRMPTQASAYAPEDVAESRWRCSKCDFRILQFPDSAWTEEADYMWFRNYMPDRAKLSQAGRLEKGVGTVALACQCSWCNVAALGGKHPHTHWFFG